MDDVKNLEERSTGSEKMYHGVLLQVYRDTVVLPDGSESVREWIDHPGASAVVPVFEDGTTVLVRQYRFPPRREFLEVPAGKIDVKGESPEEVARRELEEETGWRCGSITHLATLYPCIGYSNEVIHFYVAEQLSAGIRSLADGEMLESVTMSLSDATRMATEGRILDMKSTAALMMASTFLAGRSTVS